MFYEHEDFQFDIVARTVTHKEQAILYLLRKIKGKCIQIFESEYLILGKIKPIKLVNHTRIGIIFRRITF